MYDPKTVAHEIKFGKKTIVTIWHVDPESDGTDNSCGWFQPRLTSRDLDIIQELVDWDLKFPFYTSQSTVLLSVLENPKYSYMQQTVGDSLAYVAAAWQQISRHRDKRKQGQLTAGEWWAVVNLATNPDDNLRAILASSEDKPGERAARFLMCVMRQYLRHHRPWWRHPRWHVHHWEFQVHFVQNMKRWWLFSRCSYCGKRFSWGYSPISSAWDGGGPQWFRGENGLFHHGCGIPKRETADLTN